MTTESSVSSAELSLRLADVGDFTLEDTLGLLTDLKLARDDELDATYNQQINNQLFTPLSKSVDVMDKQQELTLSFMNQISKDSPDEYPILNTLDTFTNIITDLDNQIKIVQDRLSTGTENLKRKEEDIRRLQEKNKGFEKLKETCLAVNEITASKTYQQEIHLTTTLFKEVRMETQKVVSLLFPGDEHIKDFLALLCSAYFTSGDDMYVELEPKSADAANFLLEAGLIVYHRYDENRVRLVDL